jgi:hypothetical protein
MAKPTAPDATRGTGRKDLLLRDLLRAFGTAVLAFLLLAALPAPLPGSETRDDALHVTSMYEQRASAEKRSRSRYRRLEVASAVLIIAAGSAAILWVVRRK